MKQRHRTLRRVFSVALTLVTALAVAAPVSSAASEAAAPAQAEIQDQTPVNMEEFPNADEMSRVEKGFHLGFEGQLVLFKESDNDILLVFAGDSTYHQSAIPPYGYFYYAKYYVSMMPDHPEKGEAISTSVCLNDVFAGFGISTGTRYEITEVNEIDGTFYLSYKIFEQSKQPGHEDAEIVSGAGIISTSDGVNFSPVNLGSNTFPDTDSVTGEDTVSPYSIHKVKDTFVVTPGAPLNHSPNTATAYYTSADATNWVKRSSPDFTDVEGNATKEFNLQFEVTSVTENGIFFHAYNWDNGEQTMTEEWGVFYTEDFEQYTLASPDPKANSYHTHFDTDTMNGVLPGGKIAVISRDFTSGEEKTPVVVSFFDDETKEVKTVLTTDVKLDADDYYVFSPSLDPLILKLCESEYSMSEDLRGEDSYKEKFTVYEVSSKDGVEVKKTVIDGSERNYLWYWTAGYTFKDLTVGDEQYSFTIEANYTQASSLMFHLFDGDFQKAYRMEFRATELVGEPIERFYLYNTDSEDPCLVALTGLGYISFSLKDLVAPLRPLTVLKDEASNVSVEPSVPGALPEDTKLNVEVLYSDDAAVDKYDITLTKGEEEIQPTYPVFVTLPIPPDKANMSYKVYREEDNESRTEMIAETVDGKIRFATDHFSVYTVEWTAAEPGPGDSGNQNGSTQGGENSGSSGGTQGSTGGTTGGTASGTTGSSGSTSGSSQASSGTESGKQSPKTGETYGAAVVGISAVVAIVALGCGAALLFDGRRRKESRR